MSEVLGAEVLGVLSASLERLAAAAAAMESAAARMELMGEGQRGEIGKITAAIEGGLEMSQRELELERRLAEAEGRLAALQAEVSREESRGSVIGTHVSEARHGAPEGLGRGSARKTLPAATVQLLAKSGIDAGETVDVQSLDAALAGLGVEQRIAVKSQMLRTGVLVR